MKKGRHRRYEEARKFHRDSASQFDIEDYDFEATDGFGGILKSIDESDEDGGDDDSEEEYEDLAKKYDPDSDLLGEEAPDSEASDGKVSDSETTSDTSL